MPHALQLRPKGTVWGGVVKLPTHPYADMHGFLRAVVRHSYFSGAITCVERLGVHVLPQDLGRSWASSYSAVELALTTKHTGKVFVCALAVQYTLPEYYQRIPYPGEVIVDEDED